MSSNKDGVSPLVAQVLSRDERWHGSGDRAPGATWVPAPAGSFVFGPRGIRHTFLASSEEGQFLLVTEPAGFERFMREAGEPAARREIPPAAAEPPDVAALTKLAASYGIEITGPPGIPD